MSTEFFAIPKLDQNEKIDLIDDIIRNDLNELINKIPEKITIGVNSGGWVFCFFHNPNYYWDYGSLLNFLYRSLIFNEYDEYYSVQEFLNFVDKSYENSRNKYQSQYCEDIESRKYFHIPDNFEKYEFIKI